jgi:cytochrome P450
MNQPAATIDSLIGPSPQDERGDFDINKKGSGGLQGTVLNWVMNYPQRELLLRLLRRFGTVRFGGITVVLRDDDVREVLSRSRDFPVFWGDRMRQVTGRENFVLGMPDSDEYRRCHEQLTTAFPRSDVEDISRLSAEISASILSSGTRLDAVRELIWAVPAQLCQKYIGIRVPDPLLLADWTVAISAYLFNPGWPSRDDTSMAMTAAEGLRRLIRESIGATRQHAPLGMVLPRLIEMQRQDTQRQDRWPLTDDFIVAHLIGMIVGFIPTNLLAGGSMLDTLLRRADFMADARRAALAGDDARLWRSLRETLRFRHMNLGPFRMTGPNGYTLAAGTSREKFLKPGQIVLASTQSAMFDSQRVRYPDRFDPQRADEDYLIFGHGQHWCLGAYMAISQLTQTFKLLLSKKELRRVPGSAGRLRRLGVYPANLTVEFDP